MLERLRLLNNAYGPCPHRAHSSRELEGAISNSSWSMWRPPKAYCCSRRCIVHTHFPCDIRVYNAAPGLVSGARLSQGKRPPHKCLARKTGKEPGLGLTCESDEISCNDVAKGGCHKCLLGCNKYIHRLNYKTP